MAIMRSVVQTPLPIDADVAAIVEHVRAHRSAVIVAPPGSGKTTRIPPALTTIGRLTLGRGAKVFTGSPRGGVLTVRELWAGGKRLPEGVYTSSAGWLEGGLEHSAKPYNQHKEEGYHRPALSGA